MPARIAPVLLGSRVSFDDRWRGRVSSIEADEDWTVFNIGVSSGVFFASRAVRLPFTLVSAWSSDELHIATNSFRAFAREVPPVATPTRTLDAGTPTSHPGTRFAGLVVRSGDRGAVEVILSRGVAGLYRVPVSEVSFTGKTMGIAVQPEQLVRYYTDGRISEEIHQRVTDDPVLPTDDKRFLKIDVEDGIVSLSGNVRVPHTRDYIELVAEDAAGVVTVRNEIRDDFEIEAAIGLALNAAGAQNTGRVYVRSNLGEVGVDGGVPNQRAAEDVVRTVARVAGVRSVINRLRVGSALLA